jgi:dCMP deaminase
MTSQLSKQARLKLDLWQTQYRQEKERPDWDTIFLTQAYAWKAKSHDAQTACGAVLVRDKRIISSGYNGFIGNIDDTILPNLRPEKYPWMIHAEHNAVLDCARQGKSSAGTTMYVTAQPCLNCYQFMWQAGIIEVVYGNDIITLTNNEEYKTNVEIFLWLTKLKVRHIDFQK